MPFCVLPASSGRRGFTLVELLIVVSIIAILSAIAVPNFLEAQTRAKVSRVKNDQRSFATAIESYWSDHNRYPPRVKWPGPNDGGLRGVGIAESENCIDGCRVRDLRVFTTPISYITSLPVDVFENRIAPPNNVIDYYEPVLVELLHRGPRTNMNMGGIEYTRGKALTGTFGWALLSVGPDGIFGAGSVMGNYPVNSRPSPGNNTWWHEYDPTNGTISAGNIWRFRRNGAIGNEAFDPDWRQN
ncbi:MAG: type II secretion system protein [Candidatus Sumerlaeia bacterium]|nr:type II secretion system protein [Candidatus Sumerlaeia bacterium]